MAPEFPAETAASASPAFTRSKQMRMDDFFFCLTAIDGGSSIVMTSGAWRTSMLACPAAPISSSS